MGSGITYGNKMMEKPSYISQMKYSAAYFKGQVHISYIIQFHS